MNEEALSITRMGYLNKSFLQSASEKFVMPHRRSNCFLYPFRSSWLWIDTGNT